MIGEGGPRPIMETSSTRRLGPFCSVQKYLYMGLIEQSVDVCMYFDLSFTPHFKFFYFYFFPINQTEFVPSFFFFLVKEFVPSFIQKQLGKWKWGNEKKVGMEGIFVFFCSNNCLCVYKIWLLRLINWTFIIESAAKKK